MTSYQVSLDAAEAGNGVALGWERSVKPRIEAGTLTEIPGHRPRHLSPINAYRAPTERNPEVAQLVRLLKQHAQRESK